MILLISGDEEMTAAQAERIRTSAPEVEVIWSQSGEESAAAIEQAHVLLGLPTREEFCAARQLQWIQYPGAGVEKLWAIPELIASKVVVTNAGDIFADTMAEYTWGMMLYFTRAFPFLARMQAQPRWAQAAARPLLGELRGLTLGIVGLGAAGHAIARRAKPFGVEVLAATRSAKPQPEYLDALWKMDRLDELLARSDFVVLAVALTPQTRGLMGAAQLARMKPTAYLINISRGAVVQEPALIDVLERGNIAGAALDVFAREPLTQESKLWTMDNVFITPHIAGDSHRHRPRLIALLLENLRRFQTREPLVNVVDKRRGY